MKQTIIRLRSVLFTMLLLMSGGAWADNRVVIAELENGTISVGDVAATGDVTVTLTVTPASGYCITAEDIKVSKTAGMAMSRSKAPGYTDGINVVEDAVDALGEGTYTFKLPDGYGAYVEATFSPIEQLTMELVDPVTGENIEVIMEVTITDKEANTLRIDKITVPDTATDKVQTISIPAEVNGYRLTEIAAGALSGLPDLTDVYLPDTEKPIAIADNCIPATVKVHVSLALLDDYALMAALQANFEAGKISATVTPKNRLWTFSCGVDCILPEGVTAYIVVMDNGVPRIIPLEEEQLMLADGSRGIKANNGVLIACNNGKGGNAFEIVANPGNQKSGSVPATTNAKSYPGNCLLPTIEATNYQAGKVLILKDNKFHTIKQSLSKVKPCKAVVGIE